MTDDRDDPLLLAVEALTKPTVEHHVQKDDNGTYLKVHTATYPPLLNQLRDAVNPSNNSAGGSASLKSTRNLIDSDALYRYSLMTAAIGDWCNMAKVDRSRDPIVDLNRWYAARSRVDSDKRWYVTELTKWATSIRNLIEPPKRIELVSACPVCKSATWVDPDGQVMQHPVIIEYSLPKEGESIKPRATCRAQECGAVWASFGAITELAEEVTGKSLENRTTTV